MFSVHNFSPQNNSNPMITFYQFNSSLSICTDGIYYFCKELMIFLAANGLNNRLLTCIKVIKMRCNSKIVCCYQFAQFSLSLIFSIILFVVAIGITFNTYFSLIPKSKYVITTIDAGSRLYNQLLVLNPTGCDIKVLICGSNIVIVDLHTNCSNIGTNCIESRKFPKWIS